MRLHRRDMLRVGGLAALGGWLSGHGAAAGLGATRYAAKAKACILLWLDGGPSHLEMFDPKPEAPREVRGPFGTIATALSGVRFSEHLQRTAKLADRLAVIRSLTSPLGEHGLANQYVLTGYEPTPVLEYPSFGAVLSHAAEGDSVLPKYVAVPESRPAFTAGFLGAAHEPFATGGDPAKPAFRVNDLDFYPGVTSSRIERRREFLDRIAQFEQRLERTEPNEPTFEQAFRLVSSSEAKQAFDLAAEKPAVRAKYGPRTFGQSCLLARRLVERGVPFVSVLQSGWDTHENLVLRLHEGYTGAKEGVGLIPTFDQAFAALLEDLAERGLLETTLVIAMGEFGRTPKLNTAGGRDHWPRAFSAVLAGGGVPAGQVIGASDRTGESPAERPVTPADLARTIYTLLGIDPEGELTTPDGRPVRINAHGNTISELVG